MAQSGSGVRFNDFVTIWGQMANRAHLLTRAAAPSPESAEFQRLLRSLEEVLNAAHRIIRGGRGTIDEYSWIGFCTTYNRKRYTLQTQRERVPTLILDEAERIDVPPAASAPARTSTGRLPAPEPEPTGEIVELPPTDPSDPRWETKGAPNAILIWLNPPGEPIYRKPAVWIGAGLVGAYLGWLYYTSTKANKR